MTAETTTIVGVFNDYGKAEQAARELINNGIPKGSVHVQSSTRTAAAGRLDYETTNGDEGGISGFFHRLFGSNEDDTNRYSKAVEGGRSVVIANASGQQIDRAVAVLNKYGAVDINDDAQGYTDTGVYDDNKSLNEGASTRTATKAGGVRSGAAAGRSIPVVDEELSIGKRSVQRGGVRIYSHVVERPVEENVTLREEHVRVERRPADRQLSDAELTGLKDQTIEVMETVEEPVVQKRARVKEEVVIGKETTEKTKTVHDSTRHTEVKVEKLGNTGMNGEIARDYESDFRNDWQRNYANQGGDYSTYAPSYNYGYRYASDPRYRGRSWNEVESDLRSNYERENPGSSWDRMKNSIRYGWDKVTGR